MTDKEFRKLKRADLLEIIFYLQKETDALRKENERLQQSVQELTKSAMQFPEEAMQRILDVVRNAVEECQNGQFGAVSAAADAVEMPAEDVTEHVSAE